MNSSNNQIQASPEIKYFSENTVKISDQNPWPGGFAKLQAHLADPEMFDDFDNVDLDYYGPRTNNAYFYVLESESSISSDDGSESTYSVQNKETDVAKDTSDTDWTTIESDAFSTEYEVASDDEDEGQQFVDSHNSGSSEEEVITTTVYHAILDDVGSSADSEDSMSASSTTSEFPLPDYWKCVRCQSPNNNPMFRYCERCFKVRKEFFPPRPKRFRKKKGSKKQCKNLKQVKNENTLTNLQTYITSQCQNTLLEKNECGEPQLSLDFKNIKVPDSVNANNYECIPRNENLSENDLESINKSECLEKNDRKRNHENDESMISPKKFKFAVDSLPEDAELKSIILSENYKKNSFMNVDVNNVSDDISFSQPLFPKLDCEVQPISKSMSDPGVNFSKDDINLHSLKHRSLSDDEIDVPSHKADVHDEGQLSSKDSSGGSDSEMCITCLVEPKSGVFVHGRIAHICCCYKCSIQVWIKTKRCPICNCRVSNVLRAFVV